MYLYLCDYVYVPTRACTYSFARMHYTDTYTSYI